MSESADHSIVVVSGLPRSGTSMMMRMLEVGGLELLTDRERIPDSDNPLGYFEFEPVKNLKASTGWLDEARGKAVKIVSYFLAHLPTTHRYKVIFLRRDLDEVLASQHAMMVRRGTAESSLGGAELRIIFERHLAAVRTTLQTGSHFETLMIDYAGMVARPAEGAHLVADFLGGRADARAMAEAVVPTLYRNRREAPAETEMQQ